ncbi:MAG TPA: 23S rRNA (uracil(1939)-C(5))-methyltransferase RlmD [Bacteroidales bacterium]|nr:MAG: 23S rRNA (uracil-5-)-methyltransferase RumA [Bacteroidetes bacterium GWF2_33_38]OFY85229.1 MAG: 23S rRNA (uracil-5-)-methyltransferase RumA [Bacteroidetes bacterium RIFOXYA2_FULL_33_7]HBF88410.1 23S rRNA (uracil(1939)-C(5))-methyltransferase RlmD [Bacteroidales bacterium]
MGRKQKNSLLENVTIIDIAAEGKAIAKVNDLVVFVPFVVPGDVVDIRVVNGRKSFLEGVAIKFHKYSEIRTNPICEHFGVCGGCKWQILPYAEQLKYKQKQVVDNLERIGKVHLHEVNPILASENVNYYRNKLEYTFSSIRWLYKDEIVDETNREKLNGLGFHIPRMFDKVVDVTHCYLQKEPSNKIRLEVKDFALKNKFTFYNHRTHTGLLRNLIVRTSTTGEIMIIVIFHENNQLAISQLMNHIATHFPEITSLMYIVNEKINDTYFDQNVILFKGKDHFFEQMEDLRFKIGPKSFYQTNSEQAFNMYKIVREYADLKPTDIVYDLYTGTGTIANFVAKNAKKVIGIESIPEAIEDAKVNAEINNINNAEFFAGDMKDILTTDFISMHGTPDVIITDPPRAGMHNDVIARLLETNARKIVYVSCNAATQARDISLMSEKYDVIKIQPIDMFPYTHHVENIALLILKN